VRGISRLAVGVVACACVGLFGVPATAAGGEDASSAVKLESVHILGASQAKLLKRGVKVYSPKSGKVVVTSSTFDQPNAGRLARKARVRVRSPDSVVVKLPLTKRGREQVKSCEARTITVRVKGPGRRGRSAVGSRTESVPLKRTGACAPKPIDLSRASECDWIGQQDGSRCLFPFPSDFHTTADAGTATGKRIALKVGSMPRNAGNIPINPVDYNRLDGWSPGSTIMLKVPGLDSVAAMNATGAAPINHIGRYAEANQPIVVIDAATGERQPIWSEVDSNATSAATTGVHIHPAVNFASGHRYIVAMRNLKTAAGATIPAPEGFRYLRDELPSSAPEVNSRRAHFESLFQKLRSAGIRRSDLYLAWDFTVGSDEAIARQMLHIRDDAFGVLGDDDLSDLAVDGESPAFTVTTVDDFTIGEDAEIARRVRGTYTVPCYLAPDCGPGGRFVLDGAGLPTRNGDWTANFDCIVPRVAVDGGTPVPGRAATYGHGLFGEADEVFGADIQQELANTHGFTFCATDEIGMSGSDVGNTAGAILPDLSNFPMLADRLHQGLLNGLFLGRLMIHPDGFASDVAFHADGATLGSPSVIDAGELYYEGSSQGGIFGGALTAIAPDFTKSVLNVPAMNYSVLLPRSIDYDPFASILHGVYTDELSRPLLLSLVQMLWDRAEPNGYAHRMTTHPLPDTPSHKVLMNVAFGDHQVTNFQADVQARTIGAQTHLPALYPGRWPDVDVLWNVPGIASYPFAGSAVVYGDIGPERPNPFAPPPMIGVSPPPLTNTPNRSGEDPHGAPRGAPLALQMISDFLAPTSVVNNVCGAEACYAGGFTGP
jgi:hypothetical protein